MADNDEKLVRMLKYVSEHNDFYKNRIKEYGIANPLDISQWPILTRKELQENRYNMFSDGYKSKYYNQQLRRQFSSGSTGMPVNVYWDYKDWYASNMCLWRKRWEWYGVKPSYKYCMFTMNGFGATPEKRKLVWSNITPNILLINVSMIRGSDEYDQMAKLINDFRPAWIYIQPFVLNNLIQAYDRLNLTPVDSIFYLESVGEVLTSDLRKRAKKTFGINLINMYGSEEMNGIAFENPCAEMTVLNDNVYLEVNSEGHVCCDGIGEAVITNLFNTAMPLIRYMQCDEIALSKGVIHSLGGRFVDNFSNDPQMKSIQLFLPELIAETNNIFNDIIVEYKYVYYRVKNTLVCYIELKENLTSWYKAVSDYLYSSFIIRTSNNIHFVVDQNSEAIKSIAAGVKKQYIVLEE